MKKKKKEDSSKKNREKNYRTSDNINYYLIIFFSSPLNTIRTKYSSVFSNDSNDDWFFKVIVNIYFIYLCVYVSFDLSVQRENGFFKFSSLKNKSNYVT